MAKPIMQSVTLPAQDYRGVTDGWKKYYWRPWRKYLARR